jgi:extracellular factor (EF) 3-hydroxypalmitic acid methyl ester biosynthesis protein
MPANLTCTFRCDGIAVGPAQVLDLSATGFAAMMPSPLQLVPGAAIESFELTLADRVIWKGEAVVVHGGEDRVGGKFTSGVIDIHQLRLGATLEGRLATLREQRERLPAAWRSAVADLRRFLEDIQTELADVARGEQGDSLHEPGEGARLLEELRARWSPQFFSAVEELHEMSAGFDEQSARLGRAYASAMLMPLLAACPLQRRAYEKPLGYAGDYRMMELCYTPAPVGEGLFARFLNSVGRHYSLVRAVVAREAVMREAARAAIHAEGEGRVKIVSLASGPAMELRRLLDEVTQVPRPVELVLIDQDCAALEAAHRQLTRILLERHKAMLPVVVRCLHFSIRQLIRPMDPEEHRVRETLKDIDLIYSAGLYDYLSDPVATRLTQILHSLLRDGGRLLVGNLLESPDSTWVMEYVLGWTLHYRTPAQMLAMSNRLSPQPAAAGITMDATGRCAFLDVTKRRAV